MSKSNKLFDLIKSMSAAEKGFFKKYSAIHGRKSSNYLKLFDAIDRQDQYDESKLIQKFAGTSVAKHYSVSKNYLYNSLLASLEEFHKGNTPYDQIVHNLLRIELLINRDLVRPANQLLNQTRKLIDKHNIFEFTASITRLEYYLLRQKEDIKGIEKLAIPILNRYKSEQQKVDDQIQFRYLSTQILRLLRLGKSENHQEMLNHIKQDRVFKIPDEALGYESTIRKYNLLAMIASLENDEVTPFHYAEKLLDFSAQHPEQIQNRPYNHMVRFQNLMNRCIRIKRYDRFPALLDQLRAFPAKYKVKTRENTEKIIHVRSTAMEMTYLFETGQSESLEKVVLEMENCLSDPSFKLEPIWILAIRYSLGLYYFGFKGDLDNVLDYLDPTLHDPESALDRRYLTTCRILFLFTHLALGNEQFVYNRLSETIQFANKHKVQASFIDALIQTLKFMLNPHAQSERTAHFENLMSLYQRDQLRPDIFSGFRSLTQSILMYYHRDAFMTFLKNG